MSDPGYCIICWCNGDEEQPLIDMITYDECPKCGHLYDRTWAFVEEESANKHKKRTLK